MSDDKHTSTATIPDSVTVAATTSEVCAAAERLRCLLDAPPATEIRPGTACLAIYAAAGRVRDARDAETSSLAVAHAIAVGDVRRAVLDEMPDASDGAKAAALGRMVYEGLHVLDEEVLPGLRAAVLSERWRQWLHEFSDNACYQHELARAIAASVIESAGESALCHAMQVRAGDGFTWRLDGAEIIRTQRCRRHDEFCCLTCPQEPAASIAPIGPRLAAFRAVPRAPGVSGQTGRRRGRGR